MDVSGPMNLTSIMVIAGYLLIEAVNRAFDRPEIDGWTIVIVASIALNVDTATAALTYSMSKGSVNIKAAFLHNLAEALASVVVILTGTLFILFDWYWTDLVATVGISVYIVWISLPPTKRCIRILMQSVPDELSVQVVAATISSVEGVNAVVHIHVWPIDEETILLECRISVDDDSLSALEPLRQKIESCLSERHGITHSTIQFLPTATATGFIAQV
jgi:cobalt-zinc-cadmium efflux system protein